MAFFNGSALDRFHLLSIISERTSASGWTIEKDTAQQEGGELVLGIPNGGFVGIKEKSYEAGDLYQFILQGFSEYDPTKAFNSQPTRIPTSTTHGVAITLRNCGLRYWMDINDRRIIIIVKNGVNYESAYLGQLKSIASSTEYPLPLFISGTLRANESGNNSKITTTSGQIKNHWADESTQHTSALMDQDSNAYVLNPSNEWEILISGSSANNPFIYPKPEETKLLGRNFDGKLPLFEKFVVSAIDRSSGYGVGSVYGYLDGVFATSSEGVAAEDTIAQDGDLYFIFQDVFRSSFGNHFALKRT